MYTLSCRASLPPDFQALGLNISWLNFTSDSDIVASDTVSIQDVSYTTEDVEQNATVTVVDSDLTVSEGRKAGSRFLIGCSVNIIYRLPGGEGGHTLPRARNATKTIIIRGKVTFILN